MFQLNNLVSVKFLFLSNISGIVLAQLSTTAEVKPKNLISGELCHVQCFPFRVCPWTPHKKGTKQTETPLTGHDGGGAECN